MSSSQTASPVAAVEPLHHPNQAAHVQLPQAPLGNTTNTAYSMGTKALLAKKMAKTNNPSTVSPTDNMLTPCSAKISQVKKKHFNKAVKPLSFGSPDDADSDDEKPVDAPSKSQ
ncbi:hypothetical protein FRC02_004734 [Tulasnella sp. 418]|nr:hypothetical protein FRC02_004734 [Tulasnella sp. 418]